MSMMTSQILNFVSLAKTQKSQGSSPNFASNINPLQPDVAYLYPLN